MKYKLLFIIAGVLGLLFYIYVFTSVSYLNKAVSINSFIEATPPAGTNLYKSLIFRFFLFYPDDLQVKEDNKGGSDTTIVFENIKTGKGFQIFIVPYSENRITPEQFKKDVPSGIMGNPVEVLIDSAPATIFYSKNAVLGDTREVWFIKNGFLYEITTYRELDSWLSNIMATWKFF